MKEDYITSKWREIKSTFQHYDEGKRAIVACIDGWKTDSPNEEGMVLAQVFYYDGDRDVTVQYIDKDAMHDKYAQRVINDVKERFILINDLKYSARAKDCGNLNNIEKAWLQIEEVQQSLVMLNNEELVSVREDILDRINLALELMSPLVRNDMSEF